MKCVIILKELLRFDEGTQCKIKRSSKKCVFVLPNLQTHYQDQSSVFSSVSNHTVALSRNAWDITLIHVLSTRLNLW
jgi:hypothetical protein